ASLPKPEACVPRFVFVLRCALLGCCVDDLRTRVAPLVWLYRFPIKPYPVIRASSDAFLSFLFLFWTKGSSDFENDADVVLALLGEKALSGAVKNPRLSLRKRRSGANGEEFAFRTKVADLGLDQHGFPITTLTIEWRAEPETKQPKADAWSKSL